MKAKSMAVLAAAIAAVVHTYVVVADVALDVHAVAVVSNNVPEGATQTLAEDIRLTGRTTILKTGGGTLVAPASAAGFLPLQLQASEGTIRYQNDLPADDVQPIELPDSVKNKLALWVSVKDAAHIVSTNGTEIERWYDVRETNPESPAYRYLQALHLDDVAGPTIENARFVRKYWTSTNEMTMAYFGGYGSGKAMQILNADGSAHTARPFEVSAVYGYLGEGKRFGFFVGDCSETLEHSLWCVENGLPWNTTWGPSAGDTGIWVDGLHFVRDERNLPYGFHSLHMRFNTLTPESLSSFENALFSFHRIKGSRGGEYVGEVMFFDKRLTVGEREIVQRYLDRKWFGGRHGTARIAVESGARLDVETNERMVADLQAVGEGDFVKSGEGTLVYRPKMFENGPSASVTINGGAVEATRSLAVNVSAGDRISSDFPAMETGETLAVGAASKNSMIEKTGPGCAVIPSIPDGVRTLSVSEGTLTIRPAKPVARKYEVAIPNSDFSDWGGNTTDGNVFAEYGGWSRTGCAAFYHQDRWLTTGGKALGANVLITAYGFDKCPPPEGRCVLIMKITGGTAKVAGVTITEPGEYELSYMLAARAASPSTGSRVKNYLTDDAGQEVYIGIATAMSKNTWDDQKAFRFFVEKPGSYTLHFDHLPWYDGDRSRDAAVLINSLHLYRVGDYVANYKIPGGDFEDVSGTGVNTDGTLLFDGNVKVEGWTFDTTFAPESEGKYVRSGVADSTAYCETGRRRGSAFNASHRPFGGERQLLIRRSGGFATVKFRPPQGKWYLKAQMAHWGDYNTENGGPKLTATIKTADTEAMELGVMPVPKCYTMRPYVWATPFEADGTEEFSLTLTFRSSAGMAGVHLDDFELVGEYQNEYELIENGDFEQPYASNGSTTSSRTGWTMVSTQVEVTDEATGATKTSTGGSCVVREYGRNDLDAFGVDHGSGDYFIEPYSNKSQGGFYQDVSFPHGGWYRLSYLAKTRMHWTKSSAPIDIYLVDVAQSATNRIDTLTRMAPGVFSQRTALFHVDEACVRRLLVMTTAVHGGYVALDDFSVRYVGQDGDGALSSPDPDKNNLSVKISNGAKLQLDFVGTNDISRFYIDGVRQPYGVVNAENCPSVYGAGALLVRPRNVGVKVIIR